MSKLSLFFVICLPFYVNAQTGDTGAREITSIGCHKEDNTCYFQISGSTVGPSACNDITLRFNSELDKNGKNTLSLLTAAYFANKKVILNVVDKCYLYQPTFPTFNYFTIVN